MDERSSTQPTEQPEVDLEALTEREREVLGLALTGLSARAIAEQLTLTEATVRSHLSRIYAKKGVRGRVELLARSDGHPTGAGTPRSLEGVPARSSSRPGLAIAAAIVVLLSATFVFLWLRPDFAPTTDLTTASRLVAEGGVTSIDFRDDTVLVTTADGRRYRIEGASAAGVQALQAEAAASSVDFSISNGGDTLITSIAILATSVAPLGLLIVAILVASWSWRRLRPAPMV